VYFSRGQFPLASVVLRRLSHYWWHLYWNQRFDSLGAQALLLASVVILAKHTEAHFQNHTEVTGGLDENYLKVLYCRCGVLLYVWQEYKEGQWGKEDDTEGKHTVEGQGEYTGAEGQSAYTEVGAYTEGAANTAGQERDLLPRCSSPASYCEQYILATRSGDVLLLVVGLLYSLGMVPEVALLGLLVLLLA
jgi:hypothetical protein